MLLTAATLALLIVLVGCNILPGSPDKAVPGENVVVETGPTQTASGAQIPAQIPASATSAAADTPVTAPPATEIAAINDTVTAVDNQTNVNNQTTNQTNTSTIRTSGSLSLQSDTLLCPHLATTFSCDSYDIRRCDFAKIMVTDGFYPEIINCKDGSAKKGEDPAKKYCLIQDCEPLTEGNIVYAVGGKTAYAEYTYTKESTATGILLTYDLKRCGEMEKEFADKNKCQYYRTSSGLFS
jgi:hypothetical protein